MIDNDPDLPHNPWRSLSAETEEPAQHDHPPVRGSFPRSAGTRPRGGPSTDESPEAPPWRSQPRARTTSGSIPTQLEDARQLAERDGLEIVAEFCDEAASAFRSDRGPNLARADDPVEVADLEAPPVDREAGPRCHTGQLPGRTGAPSPPFPPRTKPGGVGAHGAGGPRAADAVHTGSEMYRRAGDVQPRSGVR